MEVRTGKIRELHPQDVPAAMEVPITPREAKRLSRVESSQRCGYLLLMRAKKKNRKRNRDARKARKKNR